MSVGVILDLLLAGLLTVTIAYAVMLNRRLGQIRGGGAQMERLVAELYQASARAEAGIAGLKAAAAGEDGDITHQLEALGKLRGDLDYLVTRAEEQSGRLERMVRDTRATKPVAAPAPVLSPYAAHDAALFGDGPSQSARPGVAKPPRRAAG